MTTTTMIRKDLFAVRRGDRAIAVRFTKRTWFADGMTFATRSAALAAAVVMVAA